MATTFSGFLVRDYFADTGVIPTQGGVYSSPDIIPYGTSTLTAGTAVSSYSGSNIAQGIISSSVNNIYVRCKNLGSSTTSGTVNLYYVPTSLFMQPLGEPGGWLNNTIGTAGGTTTPSFSNASTPASGTQISSGSIGLVNPSFYVSSFPALPANQHYCLVAASGTTSSPWTPPTSNFTTNAGFVQWVQNNPNVAWRNVTYVPTNNNNSQFVLVTSFGNGNPTTTTLTMGINASNFPADTSVNFLCTDSTFPFNETVYLPQAGTTGSQNTSLSVPAVPAKFAGTFEITVTAPSGDTFTSGAPFSVQQLQENGSNATDLERKVARAVTIYRPQADHSSRPETVQALVMGEVNLFVGSPS